MVKSDYLLKDRYLRPPYMKKKRLTWWLYGRSDLDLLAEVGDVATTMQNRNLESVLRMTQLMIIILFLSVDCIAQNTLSSKIVL